MRSLSQKTKYALRALQALAREQGPGPMGISTLSEREGIPKKFLESILLELKNQGVLKSKKGKGGGYALRLHPTEISLGHVIRIFDGTLAPLPCVSESAFVACEECEEIELCAMRSVMKEVRDAAAQILDATTIADLVRRSERQRRQRTQGGMYSI